MKRKDFLSLKKAKPFEFNDLFIYLAVIITVTVLFLAFVILPKNKTSDGFKVYKNGVQVLTFYYGDQSLIVNDGFNVKKEQVDGGVYLTVYHSEDLSSFNKLYINLADKSVVMQDSTCSNSKDCTHTPAIKNVGAIYCAPHDLKIAPINSDGKVPPTTGGI